MQQPAARKHQRQNTLNYILDIAIFVAFLVVMTPHWSGIAVHEWLSIAFSAAAIAHLLLNWQWIVGVSRRLMGRVHWFARTNYILNVLLFVAMTVAMFTGFAISEHVMELFGLQMARGGVWRPLHDLSANLSLMLFGLHLAFNWQWVVAATRRFVLAPFSRSSTHDVPQPTLPEA